MAAAKQGPGSWRMFSFLQLGDTSVCVFVAEREKAMQKVDLLVQ